MALTPTSSHGGGTFSGGTITPTTDPGLTISVPNTVADALAVYDATDATTTFGVDPFGNVQAGQVAAGGVGANSLVVTGPADGTHYVATFAPGTGGTNRVLVSPHCYLMVKAQAAPADAEVLTSYDALWFDDTAGAPVLNRKAKDSAAAVFTSKTPLRGGVTGALLTTTFSSGTGKQIDTASDRELAIPFTGDATNNAATLAIALSPDGVTYSTLDTLSIAAALNLTGALNVPVTLTVPAGWFVKLTASHGTIGTATYY